VKPEEALVSEETGDDAAVYRMPDGGGLVVSVDVFTPIVDDPRTWGQIAAANAFSDIYAMGAKPFMGLNIAGWPVDEVPLEMLAEVLRGAAEKTAEAGAAIMGGHTITTEREPMFGMVALGTVDPHRMVRNSTVEPGMQLYLTKPIGTGIIATAIKRDVATAEQAAAAVTTMMELNAAAAAAMTEAGAGAATDVTGFGLLGHLRRMLEASGCAATLDASAVPLLPGVLGLAERDVVPSGTKRNHSWVSATTDFGSCTPAEQLVLSDAQTSGGLLIATRHPDALETALDATGASGVRIGTSVVGQAGVVSVVGRPSGGADQP
jgi:selenide,water dikinase